MAFLSLPFISLCSSFHLFTIKKHSLLLSRKVFSCVASFSYKYLMQIITGKYSPVPNKPNNLSSLVFFSGSAGRLPGVEETSNLASRVCLRRIKYFCLSRDHKFTCQPTRCVCLKPKSASLTCWIVRSSGSTTCLRVLLHLYVEHEKPSPGALAQN